MKAIETKYKGHRYRSRLEARWAIFFDTLGVPFQYEPEGFKFEDGTHYLPDFYLPEQKAWIEIKGGEISQQDKHKVEMLSEHIRETGRHVYLFGEIPRVEYRSDLLDAGDSPYAFVTQPYGTSYYTFFRADNTKGITLEAVTWYICAWCNRIEISTVEMGIMCACHTPIEGGIPTPSLEQDDFASWWFSRLHKFMGDTRDHPRLMLAYQAASQARFEHGETGQ